MIQDIFISRITVARHIIYFSFFFFHLDQLFISIKLLLYRMNFKKLRNFSPWTKDF